LGVFWWFHHQNTPKYPVFYGDSQRHLKAGDSEFGLF
jgi:hypothetical protein